MRHRAVLSWLQMTQMTLMKNKVSSEQKNRSEGCYIIQKSLRKQTLHELEKLKHI